jgi:predicted transcriptional regulator
MKSKIIEQIKTKFANTNSGITIVELMELNGMSYSDVKTILTELYKEKKIITRESINQILIYIKQ